jgi:hypothetical protein
MNELESVLSVIRALEELNAEYLVSGSFASNFWGRARSTRDVDIVIRMESLDLSAFFDKLGDEFEVDAQMQFEGVTGTQRYVVTHRQTRFQAELFILTDDAFDRSRFARRAPVSLEGVPTDFATAEDVVVQKLLWLQRTQADKHREDVRAVLAVQGQSLDWDYIHRWTDEHGTRALLDEILRSIEAP